MRVIVCENYDEMSLQGAKLFESQIRLKPNSILGLATGSTPIGMYQNLIKMYKEEGLDFSKITSFNLDEYYPISQDNDQSYRYFMNEQLFNHINIDKEKTFVPNGEAKDSDLECKQYEEKLAQYGGVDIQLLGIGRNGHIGFNEPGDKLYASTHKTGLTQDTIEANSRFFADIKDVPTQALTMGIGSIMKAKTIVLLASGKNKHDAVKALLDDYITTEIPCTLLKAHPDFILICDKDAYEG
ncbi:MAG: glucosamine-6-phosphate deaminase [Clostridia bacterium]|nr:glucosamine-6-phosphate deaminase [Clostridia bacterium]